MKSEDVSVDTKSTQEKEKNINEEKNKEYEAMCERVQTFKFFENLNKIYKKIKENENDENDIGRSIECFSRVELF